MNYLRRGTKETQQTIKIALKNFKVFVKLNTNGSIALYPRVSKEFSENVWSNDTAKEMIAILTNMGFIQINGAISVGSGNIYSIEGIYIPA